MPTRAEFERAGAAFDDAAASVADLTAAVEGADASNVIRGGVLGRQVPARITTASATARSCQALIQEAAETCRLRAQVIAEYEVRLELYDRAFAAYAERSYSWNYRYNRWWRDPLRMMHPGSRPVPPLAPVHPPSWAEVRRP